MNPIVILSPDTETSYTYTIGSKMVPLIYKVNFNTGFINLKVNEEIDNPYESFGLILNSMPYGSDTVIYLRS